MMPCCEKLVYSNNRRIKITVFYTSPGYLNKNKRQTAQTAFIFSWQSQQQLEDEIKKILFFIW